MLVEPQPALLVPLTRSPIGVSEPGTNRSELGAIRVVDTGSVLLHAVVNRARTHVSSSRFRGLVGGA